MRKKKTYGYGVIMPVSFIGNVSSHTLPIIALRYGFVTNKRTTVLCDLSVHCGGLNCYDIRVFFDGISGAAITMKYNQMNAELIRNKKLSDKIATLKQQLLNI